MISSFQNLHLVFVDHLVIGTMQGGSPSMCTNLGGFVNFTNEVSNIGLPCDPIDAFPPATVPSAPFVI
jgi:hypothetical protein